MNRQTRFLRLSMKQNDRSCVWVTDWYENTGKSELWGISRTAPKVRFKWILEIVGRSDEDGGVAPGKSTKYLLQLLHLHFLIMRLKLKHWYYRGLFFFITAKEEYQDLKQETSGRGCATGEEVSWREGKSWQAMKWTFIRMISPTAYSGFFISDSSFLSSLQFLMSV